MQSIHEQQKLISQYISQLLLVNYATGLPG